MTPVMTPERWRKIEDIYQAIVEAPQPEQAALLRQYCGADETLRHEIEVLLTATADDDFLQIPIQEAAQSLPLRREDDLLDQHIGPYHIVKQLGQGGMGAVYLAERDDAEYYRQVALKVVKRGMDSGFVLNRFRVERQILATLEHPNIAQLLDGGSTPDGLPYFVMEYVAGQPLTDYCRAHELALDARLRLFLPICAAVQHAHQKLIVHRDLKPSNILVTAEGVPKLLDFGIAKLLDPSLAPIAAPRTLTSVRMMTPDYASPEQVRGLPISTASDVYSLGAVLYELLTGERPHHFASYAPAEIERAVCDTAIERPSVVAQRATSAPSRTHKQLTGDLDNIVLMALRKEPERRYQSVEQFAEDLRRYLAGRPIAARNESLTYRTGKFVRRNKLAVAAAALIFVSLLGGMLTTARAARLARAERARAEANLAVALAARNEAEQQRAEAERQRLSAEEQRTEADRQRARAAAEAADAKLQRELAEAQRAEAEAQRTKAETQQARAERRFAQVRKLANTFLFDFHDRIAALPGATPAREMVVKTALEYLDNLAQEAENDPALLAELAVAYAKVGDVQGLPGRANLGQSKAALENYGKAIQLSEKVLAQVPDNEVVRRTLAATYTSVGLLKMLSRAFAEAKQYAGRSLTAAERLPLNKNAELENFRVRARPHDLLFRLATLEHDQAESLRQAQLMVAIQEQGVAAHPGEWSQRLLTAGYSTLSIALQGAGDLVNAVATRQRAIALIEPLVSARPADAPLRYELKAHYSNLADLLANPATLNLGQAAEAVAYLRKAITLTEELIAADPKNMLPQRELPLSYQLLGVMIRSLDPAESVRLLKKSQELADKLATPGRQLETDVSFRLKLAWSEWLAGDRQNARQNLGLAQQSIREKANGLPGVAPYFYHLEIGKLLLAMEEAQAAQEYLQLSLAMIRKVVADQPGVLLDQAQLADCFFNLGKAHALRAARIEAALAQQSAWQEARNYYQQSLAVWQDWPNKAASTVYDQSRAAAVKQALAHCDTALARLSAK